MADVKTPDDYRPDWKEYFMGLAISAAERASCLRHQFGAAVEMNKILAGTGYNGFPRGYDSCYEQEICRKHSLGIEDGVKNTGNCFANHAETNAVLHALAHTGTMLEGASLFSLGYPCSDCAKLIANTGIDSVYYMLDYIEPDSQTRTIFEGRKPTVKLERLATPYLEARLDLMRRMRKGEFKSKD